MIDPIVLKGFRDSLPGEEIPKKNIERKLESVFESFGFVPIDTPVLEYESVLLGKGGGETDKQIFHFEDNGGRKVATSTTVQTLSHCEGMEGRESAERQIQGVHPV